MENVGTDFRVWVDWGVSRLRRPGDNGGKREIPNARSEVKMSPLRPKAPW